MGNFTEIFQNQSYLNEDHVAHNFVTPLLKDFLGYNSYNIFPKKRYKARSGFELRKVNVNRDKKHKLSDFSAEPDFIIVDDKNYRNFFYRDYQDKGLFLVEVKNPNESLEKYIPQYNAYCAITNTNLILTTNGKQLRIYDFNELLIKCDDISEVDLKLPLIRVILHKKNQYIELKYKIKSFCEYEDETIFIDSSDFIEYIKENKDESLEITLLKETFSKYINFEKYSYKIDKVKPIIFNELFRSLASIKSINKDLNELDQNKKRDKKPELIEERNKSKQLNKYIIIGDSGIGKSLLFRFLKLKLLRQLHTNKTKVIPILIPLKIWRFTSNILDLICEELKSTYLKKDDIKSYLIQGRFLILFDAYDEISINMRGDFFKALSRFVKTYNENLYLVSSKPELHENAFKRIEFEFVKMEPPELPELQEYVQNNINLPLNEFIDQIKQKNLQDFSKIPLFLNLLLLYVKQYRDLPASKYELLEKLVKHYFEEHLNEKYLMAPILTEGAHIFLSNLAFEMVFNIRKKELDGSEFRIKFKEISLELKDNGALDDEVSDDMIKDFLFTSNLIVKDRGNFRFWHPILLYYFCSYKFAEEINDNKIDLKSGSIFSTYDLKDLIVISFPLIKNQDYIDQLKDNNLYLYLECLLETEITDQSKLDRVLEIIKTNMTSEFRFIRDVSRNLFNKIIDTIDNPENFLYEIIIGNKNLSDLTVWGLEKIGKLRTEGALQVLKELDIFDAKEHRDFFGKPIKGHYITALSNFDNSDIQNYIINEIEKQWRGVYYLESIGIALLNITKRGVLSKDSFNRIYEIFKNPKDMEIKFDRESMVSYIRKRALLSSLIEYRESSIVPELLELLNDNLNLILVSDIENLIVNIVTNNYIPIIMEKLKNDSLNREYKESLAIILQDSELTINFNEILEILNDLKDKGLSKDQFDMELFNTNFLEFRQKHPIYEMSYLFSILLECFLKDHRVKNLDREDLIEFSKSFINFPHEFVQESVFKIFKKFTSLSVFDEIVVFYGRSALIFVRHAFKYAKKRAIDLIQNFFKIHFETPKEFHDHYMLSEFLKLLIEMEDIETAKDLYTKYIEINDSSSNVLIGLHVLSNFPSDYALNMLEVIKKNCDEKSQSMFLFNCPPINSDEFIDFCIDIGNSLTKDRDFEISRLFGNLYSIDCSNKEKELVTFLEEKINQGYDLVGTLNLLAYIGTDISVNFLRKYLDSPNDLLKQKAFYCIRYIKERQNQDWYNDLERIHTDIL